MSNKIRLGIIGFGGFGDFIFKSLSHSEHFKLVAIADSLVDEEKIPKGIIFTREWKQIINSESIDAVVIATPPRSHAQLTIESLKAGKHVLTEKPIALSVIDAQKIVAASNKYKKTVMVDFLQRFNPLLEILNRLYKDNIFGEFERFYVENYAQDETLPPSHWFWDQNISGGILLEHAVHFIDIVHWFKSGNIEDIAGFADYRNPKQADRMAATVKYEEGLIASHYHSFSRPNDFEHTNMRFVFNTAQFDLTGWIPENGSFSVLGSEETLVRLNKLPNMKLKKRESLDPKQVRGNVFEYSYLFEGTFSSARSKKELYASCVQMIFQDFYHKINDDNHQTRVTLKDAVKAVFVAEHATADSKATTSKRLYP